MKIYSISEPYGIWHPAGFSIFCKFPKFSFINIKDEQKLAADYLLVDNPNSVLLDKTFGDRNGDPERKVYIRISKDTQSKIDMIMERMPAYVLTGGKNTKGIAELLNEIVFGIKEDPKLQRDILLKALKTKPDIYKFTQKRPFESLPD